VTIDEIWTLLPHGFIGTGYGTVDCVGNGVSGSGWVRGKVCRLGCG
jgi:hypothetical protein